MILYTCKANCYYYAYGYGYHLLLSLFLLYVIQSYNDYCYYYYTLVKDRKRIVYIFRLVGFYDFKYYDYYNTNTTAIRLQLL